MDLPKIIGELVAERDRLDAAILALERLKRNASSRARPGRGKDLDPEEPAEDTPASDLVSK